MVQFHNINPDIFRVHVWLCESCFMPYIMDVLYECICVIGATRASVDYQLQTKGL